PGAAGAGGGGAGQDARADDGEEEEAGAERFGGQSTGQVELEAAGASLRLVGQLAHDATSPVMRSRSSPTVASKAALVGVATGSGTDQCSHVGSGSSSSWA